MIRKAQNLDLQLTNDLHINQFVQFLYEELNAKVEGITKDSMLLFERLITRLLESRKLYFEGVVMGGVLVGGILIVQGQGRHLYLKGTATREAKKLGVYYWLMHRAIERARAEQATFDFGGSGIEGVAQFNRNFGAVDAFYSRFTWGKIPLLFNILKRLKQAWKRMNV
jgi:hypothetical protein